MYRRKALILLSTTVILALTCSGALAQVSIAPEPDAGVRGSGAIPIAYSKNIGAFDINVIRSGTTLLGGFRYSEMSSNTTQSAMIYSERITALEVRGNTATITALGYWNNMPSRITVEVLDDNFCGDWFRIIATPQNMLPVIYDQAGGLIRGDIAVFSKPALPDAFARGEGTIAIYQNRGTFKFHTDRIGGVVKGSLYYNEFAPFSSVIGPRVTIVLPEVTGFRVNGGWAIMTGQGTLNGRPAQIEVQVEDSGYSIDQRPDYFYIIARPLTTEKRYWMPYEAGGPLIQGDIVVRTSAMITK